MSNTIDEKTLIAGLKRRDDSAFKLLLHTYKNTVANICYRFLFNRQDAEEVSQEVFIDIYRGIPSFRGESKLSTWIYQLAAAKSIDLLRSRKRKKRFGQVLSLLGVNEKQEIPDPRHYNPQKNIEDEEKSRIIRAAIDALPMKYRQVFTLSKCEEFSNKQVAEILGISQSAVETIVSRASKKLREKLYVAFEKELQKNSKKVQTQTINNVSKNRNIFFIIIGFWALLFLLNELI